MANIIPFALGLILAVGVSSSPAPAQPNDGQFISPQARDRILDQLIRPGGNPGGGVIIEEPGFPGVAGDDIVIALPPSRTIDNRYIYCNVMQLSLARSPSWSEVYRSLGAEAAAVDVVYLAQEALARHYCLGLPQGELNTALDALDEVHASIDAGVAQRLGIGIEGAADLRRSLIHADAERIRRGCFQHGHRADELLLARLPMTPDIGLELPQVPASAAFGVCPSGMGGGGARQERTRAFDMATVKSCRDDFLSSYAQCTSPLGEDLTQEQLNDTADDLQDSISDACSAAGPDCSTHVGTDDDGNTASTTTVRSGETTEAVSITTRDGDVVRVSHSVTGGNHTVDLEYNLEPSLLDRAEQVVADFERAHSLVQRAFNAIHETYDSALGPGGRALRDAIAKESPKLIGGALRLGRGGVNQCEAINPASASPIGYMRSGAAPPDLRPGPISGVDIVAYCMCQEGGRRGQELANDMGFGCRGEWAERMSCLANPYDRIDRIRRECLQYLVEDNDREASDKLEGVCSFTVQCPETQAALFSSSGGTLTCQCRPLDPFLGGGPSRNNACDLVYCSSETPSADSARFGLFEECCRNGNPPRPFVPVDPDFIRLLRELRQLQ